MGAADGTMRTSADQRAGRWRPRRLALPCTPGGDSKVSKLSYRERPVAKIRRGHFGIGASRGAPRCCGDETTRKPAVLTRRRPAQHRAATRRFFIRKRGLCDA
jgi:hypothetical protein